MRQTVRINNYCITSPFHHHEASILLDKQYASPVVLYVKSPGNKVTQNFWQFIRSENRKENENQAAGQSMME
jgi:hypothetical protein